MCKSTIHKLDICERKDLPNNLSSAASVKVRQFVLRHIYIPVRHIIAKVSMPFMQSPRAFYQNSFSGKLYLENVIFRENICIPKNIFSIGDVRQHVAAQVYLPSNT